MNKKWKIWWIQFTYENPKFRKFIDSICEVERILNGNQRK
jgi:hypothetical protein